MSLVQKYFEDDDDPVEDELIRQAASDCLAELRKINSSGAITRFVFSGNDSLRIRVSKVTRPIPEKSVDFEA